MIDLPPEFDPSYYRKIKPYLQLNDVALQREFDLFGRKAGAPGSFFCYREVVLKVFKKTQGLILEIGPGHGPDFVGDNVRYLDIVSSEELQNLYPELPDRNGGTPKIDYLLSDLVEEKIKEKFDLVYSAHNFEHQANCVLHINSISEILNSGGFFVVVVPDRNYTFDYYRPSSTLVDILSAPESQTSHSMRTLMCSRVTTHNEPLKHWLGEHGESKINDESIIKTYFSSNMEFKSQHVNTFDPKTFKNIFGILSEKKVISLNLLRVYNTPFSRNEFIAIFRKDNKKYIYKHI